MTGCHRILYERSRQLLLAYNDAHDASHAHGELSRAALARLLVADYKGEKIGICDVDLLTALVSPWDNGAPLLRQTRERLLVEAGALIAAELDRMNPAAPSDDDRPTYLVMAAIGDFARAISNVGRINDMEQRLKVLSLLGDFAKHFAALLAAELDQVIPPLTGGGNGHHKPKEEN